VKKITSLALEHCEESVRRFRAAKKAVALTGAGISVESGIDDFRSPGGLWSRFPPEEYATLDVFRSNPEKSWRLFRAVGKDLVGKKPNNAHRILAELEIEGYLKGVITQNIDNLHQQGGSRNVLEMHGNHHYLQCPGCGNISVLPDSLLRSDDIPRCILCHAVVKPDVVLFGENIHCFREIDDLLHHCDLLMVVGTSAQVYPAALLPEQVRMSGGLIYEFNINATALTAKGCDYFFRGPASVMLHQFLKCLKAGNKKDNADKNKT
jgi:NAD-dependent deacetylase